MSGKVGRFIAVLLCVLLCHEFDLTNSTRRKIQTNRPIIGIVAQSTAGMTFQRLGKTYIPASSVKFLESSGARVIPIFNNLTEVETKKLFESINGAFLPGGVVSPVTSGYANVSRTIFELAKKTFDEGGYFPVMGLCLGHQFFGTVVNGNTDIRIQTDSNNMTSPLNLPKNYRDSKLFRGISEDLVKEVNQTLITAHYHNLALPLKLFRENEKLGHFYRVITTNVDRNGVEFVSTMEAKKYPFYSVQWHPEKVSFEWCSIKPIPHCAASIELSQYISNFFVQEARYSKHKFASEKEEKGLLIYNYNPTYIGTESTIFEQIYLFN